MVIKPLAVDPPNNKPQRSQLGLMIDQDYQEDRPVVGKRGYICAQCGQVKRAPNPLGAQIEFDGPGWPRHCDSPMRLMGHRQAQAAALLTSDERLKWIQLGVRVMKGKGRRKWRPIMSEKQLDRAYPLS